MLWIVDWLAYEDHLTRGLCWVCGVPTRRSHLQQRQCPACRRKWSFVRLRADWALLQAFLVGKKAYKIHSSVGVSYPTAQKHFRLFENALRDRILDCEPPGRFEGDWKDPGVLDQFARFLQERETARFEYSVRRALYFRKPIEETLPPFYDLFFKPRLKERLRRAAAPLNLHV